MMVSQHCPTPSKSSYHRCLAPPPNWNATISPCSMPPARRHPRRGVCSSGRELHAEWQADLTSFRAAIQAAHRSQMSRDMVLPALDRMGITCQCRPKYCGWHKGALARAALQGGTQRAVWLNHGTDGGNGASGPTVRFVPPIVRVPSPFARKGKSLKFEGDTGSLAARQRSGIQRWAPGIDRPSARPALHD